MIGSNEKTELDFYYNGITFLQIDGRDAAIIHQEAIREKTANAAAAENLLENLLSAGTLDDYLIPALFRGRVFLELENGRTALDNPARTWPR